MNELKKERRINELERKLLRCKKELNILKMGCREKELHKHKRFRTVHEGSPFDPELPKLLAEPYYMYYDTLPKHESYTFCMPFYYKTSKNQWFVDKVEYLFEITDKGFVHLYMDMGNLREGRTFDSLEEMIAHFSKEAIPNNPIGGKNPIHTVKVADLYAKGITLVEYIESHSKELQELNAKVQSTFFGKMPLTSRFKACDEAPSTTFKALPLHFLIERYKGGYTQFEEGIVYDEEVIKNDGSAILTRVKPILKS